MRHTLITHHPHLRSMPCRIISSGTSSRRADTVPPAYHTLPLSCKRGTSDNSFAMSVIGEDKIHWTLIMARSIQYHPKASAAPPLRAIRSEMSKSGSHLHLRPISAANAS